MHTRYEIKPVKTSKDEIVHPALALESVIPKLNTSTIICGKSGSGKSVLLHALITEKRFYDKYRHFDKIFLVSPTGEQDDVQRSLGLPENSCVFTDLKEANQALEMIEAHQTSSIKKLGSAKAKKVCLIFDDCAGHTSFMNSPAFVSVFIRARHFNATVFFLTQVIKRLPKICRMQASFLVFFAISQNEASALADEFCPPGLPKKNFLKMIDDVLGGGAIPISHY